MRKGVLIAGVLVVGLVALVAVGVPLVERHAAATLKSEIEADGSQVGAVEVSLLERSVTLSDLRSKRAGEVTLRRWKTSGLSWPLDELLRGRTPLSGLRLGDPLAANRVELEEVRATEADGTQWAIGAIVMEGFRLARYDADVGPGPGRMSALGARILRAVSLRRFEERNVVVVMPDTADTFKAGELRFEGIAAGKVAVFAMTNFEVTDRGASQPAFKLAGVNGKDIDISRVLAAMSSPVWQPGAPLGRINLGAVNVTGFGGALLSRYGISVDDVTFRSVQESRDVVRSETRIRNFVMSPPLRSLESLQIRMAMQTMGLKSLKLEFGCVGTEDHGKGEFTVERCALTGQELGEIDFTMRITQADPIFWQALDNGDMDAFMHSKASLATAKLVIADNSLLDRSLKAAAAATGQPTAQLRAEIAREVRRFQPAGVLITEDLTKLLDTVARFIERGGTLTIEANPTQPFGVDRIAYIVRPGPDLVDALGLSARLSR